MLDCVTKAVLHVRLWPRLTYMLDCVIKAALRVRLCDQGCSTCQTVVCPALCTRQWQIGDYELACIYLTATTWGTACALVHWHGQLLPSILIQFALLVTVIALSVDADRRGQCTLFTRVIAVSAAAFSQITHHCCHSQQCGTTESHFQTCHIFLGWSPYIFDKKLHINLCHVLVGQQTYSVSVPIECRHLTGYSIHL